MKTFFKKYEGKVVYLWCTDEREFVGILTQIGVAGNLWLSRKSIGVFLGDDILIPIKDILTIAELKFKKKEIVNENI